jgi:hypothetical protein
MASRSSRIFDAAVERAEALQIDDDPASEDAFTDIEFALHNERMREDAAGPNFRALFGGSFGVTSKGMTMPEELLGKIIGEVCWDMEFKRRRHDSDKASNILLYLYSRDTYHLT